MKIRNQSRVKGEKGRNFKVREGRNEPGIVKLSKEVIHLFGNIIKS